MKLSRLNFKLLFIWLGLCALGGALLGWLSGMSFWIGAGVVAIALFVNGVVAEAEDNAPGRFNNP